MYDCNPHEDRGWPVVRILICDDLLANRVLMSRALSVLGFDSLKAEDGDEALVMAGAERPDLILLDRHMPGISGDDVLRRLKARPELRDIPVVIVTGDSDPALLEFLMTLGADAVLRKPYRMSELAACIQDSLEGHGWDNRSSACAQHHTQGHMGNIRARTQGIPFNKDTTVHSYTTERNSP